MDIRDRITWYGIHYIYTAGMYLTHTGWKLQRWAMRAGESRFPTM